MFALILVSSDYTYTTRYLYDVIKKQYFHLSVKYKY